MSLTNTPASERLHIGFFGRRNAGKSSLVNAIAGQNVSVVSDVKGTTTDPVTKTMELLPLGPVVLIDTPGFDDEGSLGLMRVERTKEILKRVDIAVLVCDAEDGLNDADTELTKIFKEKNIPYIVAYNKSDVFKASVNGENEIAVSAKENINIELLKEKISLLIPQKKEKSLTAGFIDKGEIAVLVTPIDEAAPKGRLILPQQQVIRDLLDRGCAVVVAQPDMLPKMLEELKGKVRVVITDSQAFKEVSKIVPEDIMLTSFSILMANYKGFLETAVPGVLALENLKDGDKVLISEGCTHHRQCNDIGSVKLPKWIGEYTGKKLEYTVLPGHEFPEDLSEFSLVVHCGGCMITEREVHSRMESAVKQNIPFTNYGITIAQVNGILKRSIEVFPELYKKM